MSDHRHLEKVIYSDMNLFDELTSEVELLMVEYSQMVDITLGSFSDSRNRNLRCGICFRRYKYHAVLANHVYSNEIFK